MVYVGSEGNAFIKPGVYALNASSGALLWNNSVGNVDSTPAVANGVVYVGSFDGNVYALDASTGAPLWSYATGAFVYSPAVANGVVYVGSDAGIYALNASTHFALELHCRRGHFLARSGKWSGLCRLRRLQSLRLRPDAR